MLRMAMLRRSIGMRWYDNFTHTEPMRSRLPIFENPHLDRPKLKRLAVRRTHNGHRWNLRHVRVSYDNEFQLSL
jgi:hypothetical protein